MPPTILADAWFFIALYDRYDNHHAQAVRLLRAFSEVTLLTHEPVMAEVLAYFSTEGAQGRSTAVDAVCRALTRMTVITPDRPLFLRALDLYAARPDKEYSLVDCMSMVIMRERAITHVLTNDHHFRQEGFTVLSDAQ